MVMLLSGMISLRIVSLPILSCVWIVSKEDLLGFPPHPSQALQPCQMFRVYSQCPGVVGAKALMHGEGNGSAQDGILEPLCCDSMIEIWQFPEWKGS